MDNIDLEFDQASHTYRYKGNIVSGVTSVLENVGISDFSMVAPDVLSKAMEFGTEVHHVCELLDTDQPLPDDISDLASLYLCHYVKFLNDFGVEFLEVETKVFCKTFMYAGTLDRVAIFRNKSNDPIIFDIKTGSKSRSHQIQTAAYEYAYRKDKRKNMDRYTLYLSEDGYRLSEVCNSRKDFDVFLAALTINNYKNGVH